MGGLRLPGGVNKQKIEGGGWGGSMAMGLTPFPCQLLDGRGV